MPKSSFAELKALRRQVFERDGGCVWPVYHEGSFDNPLELVHLRHRGMGGSVEANTPENCVCMCRFHHSVYDGRIVGVTARAEWARLFRTLAGL